LSPEWETRLYLALAVFLLLVIVGAVAWHFGWWDPIPYFGVWPGHPGEG
jgi:hypothetical protein